MKFHENFSSQRHLSCAIALSRVIIENLDLPYKTTEGLCSVLVTPVTDWLNNVSRLSLYLYLSIKIQIFQTWEETTNDSLDRLNHIGPLRKNKNAPFDDNPSYASTSLDINRYKRRFSALMERVCRLCSKKDITVDENNALDNDLVEEENEDEHTSDWLSDNRSQIDLKQSQV